MVGILTLLDLFADNEDVDRVNFTKLVRMLEHGQKFELVFNDSGVFASYEVNGVWENLEIHHGMLSYKFEKGK